MRRRFTFCFTFFALSSLFAQESSSSFERKNLGANVNSKYTDMTPRISADGQTLFFVREGDPINKNRQDIWYSEMGDDGHWKQAKRADKSLNRVDFNCVWSVNTDGNSVLLRGAFVNGAFVGRGFSVTRRTKDGWSDPEMIKIESIESIDHGDNDGAYMSVDGNAIIFTMCEKQNCHANDLYVSTKKEDGTFTKPVKIAGNVNSTSNEFAPFLASDNKTLYFSSDRPGGLGQSDIYKTERLDTSWTNWSNPVNLGAPINTPHKDGYFVADAKSEFAYIVSDQNSLGGADIIKIRLSKDQMSQPVVLFNGIVSDAKTKKPVSATIEYSVYPNDTDEGVAHTEHHTGEYKFVLPYGDSYVINIAAKGYLPYYDTISLGSTKDYREIKRDYSLAPVEVGQGMVLNNVYFESAKYDLLPESSYQLDRIVKLMNDNKRLEVEVSGHTDDDGEELENQRLSQERAVAVVNYLVSKGIGLHRLKAVGYGEKKPLKPNDSAENKKTNRRVEFLILKK